jgi:hypothetical protein
VAAYSRAKSQCHPWGQRFQWWDTWRVPWRRARNLLSWDPQAQLPGSANTVS